MFARGRKASKLPSPRTGTPPVLTPPGISGPPVIWALGIWFEKLLLRSSVSQRPPTLISSVGMGTKVASANRLKVSMSAALRNSTAE
jgi:hypothetical protein